MARRTLTRQGLPALTSWGASRDFSALFQHPSSRYFYGAVLMCLFYYQEFSQWCLQPLLLLTLAQVLAINSSVFPFIYRNTQLQTTASFMQENMSDKIWQEKEILIKTQQETKDEMERR